MQPSLKEVIILPWQKTLRALEIIPSSYRAGQGKLMALMKGNGRGNHFGNATMPKWIMWMQCAFCSAPPIMARDMPPSEFLYRKMTKLKISSSQSQSDLLYRTYSEQYKTFLLDCSKYNHLILGTEWVTSLNRMCLRSKKKTRLA